ncbi:hypothetical protein MAP00_004937 [Monascus purpureus]|nr:hypothetical protein MAP00_004937 [Monascus purpureus]
MDTSPQGGSNSVTVEYTDPSGLFPLVQPIIETKLPLRNLHWNSPNRPIRSIESLRIRFVPATGNEPSERKPSSDAATGPVTYRRHQIPGLRQTPYLKIYLLRCDDNDTYKASARKALREWIKTNAPTSQSSSATASNQENHDAFEWLVLHVVQDGDGLEKTVSASKWPGRNTTTVFEKIKADFNPSSKSSIDRVAQLRLPKPEVKRSPEFAEQLEELVEKMKNAILASFDLRVAQYEEDIKEKDSQRSLPGWNFCTFFILKEGLARGFENVGLFEDALIGYDELSVGLDAAIREQLFETNGQRAGALLMSSKEWREKAIRALESLSVDSDKPKPRDEVERKDTEMPVLDPEDFPLNSDRKPYRDMILANDISIFDFRAYLFSRQLTLLLRAARAPSLAPKGTEESQGPQRNKKKPEDLMLLSEVCERATEFIAIAARTLRYDLECGLEGVDDSAKTDVINNLVSSWSFLATSQIISQTATPLLTIPASPLHAAMAEARPDVPRRSSSLLSPPSSRPRPTSQEIVGAEFHKPVNKTWSTVVQKTGSEQLASGRGQLFFLARRFLDEIAGRCGWTEKWNEHELGLLFADKDRSEGDLKEVSLEDDGGDGAQEVVSSTPEPKKVFPLSCIDIPILTATFESKEAYFSLYEELTDQMFRHFVTANRTHSAEMAVADIAFLRFRQADYATAATYFHQISPFYGNNHWVVLEGAMLEMYARCLKELKKNEEHVRVMLRLLAKFAAYDQAKLSNRAKALGLSSTFSEEALVSKYVEELFETANSLPKEISVPLSDFFADLHINPAVIHYGDRDGFQMQLALRYLLGKQISIDSIKIRLVNALHSQNNEHWLENSRKFVIKPSSTKILIDSSMTLQGKYLVDRIEMRAGNIAFTISGGNFSTIALGYRDMVDSNDGDNRPHIHCYAAPDGLQAKIVTPHLINLDDMRTLEVEFNSGRNDIKTGTIRVRPATAGLRLRVAEAKVVDGDIKVNTNNESGNIEFTQFGPRSFARFRIPYTVDENHSTLSARLEVTYETAQGRFSYSSVYNILSALPISVNVQDIFKEDALFSRFTVSPATMTPLRILGCRIPSSEVFEVQPSIPESTAMDVFPKQPASLVYKIRQREEKAKRTTPKSPLLLTIEFTCVDDESLDAIERKFRSDIEKSKFRQYTSLLSSHIVQTVRTRLSASDMEVIGLVREIEMLPYQSLQWESLLGSLEEPREEIRKWLIKWHEDNHTIALPENPSILKRRLVIPLDIQSIQVVCTAELRLHGLAAQPTHAAVGQMIAAELHLRHTRRWGSQEAQETSDQPLEFTYDIYSNPDLWLIGGRKRGNFTAVEGETKTFSVMLLPQKAGHLLVPGLEIKVFEPLSSSGTSQNADDSSFASSTAGTADGPGGLPSHLQRRPVACEVDYRNHGETLLVIPDLRKTTVSLSPSGGQPGSGSWLVDSERRQGQMV